MRLRPDCSDPQTKRDGTMKAVKLILIPIIIVAAIYLGLKGFVYYQTTSKVDELVKQASLFADITYDGVSSDLMKGSVSVNNIRVTPKTLQDALEIREVTMQGDGPAFLFTDTSKMSQQTPEFLLLAVRGLRLGLDGEMFQSFNTMAAQQAKAQNIPVAKTCEFGSSISSEDLKAIGFDAIYADASMTVSHDKIDNSTSMTMDLIVEDMGSFDMSSSMIGGGSPMMMAMQPKIDEIRFVYSVDEEYLKNVKKYCSEKLKIDELAYIKMIAEASDDDFKTYYGFAPGPGIRNAIKTYMTSGGDIDIRLRPSKEMNPMLLQTVRPQDILDMLGATVYVNKQPIQDLSFELSESYNAMLGGQPAQTTKDEEEAVKKKKRVVYTFQDTPVSQLPQYIGARVRLETKDGKGRDGTLISISKNIASIEQRINSGKFTVHVQFEDIKNLQVHRLVKMAETEAAK